MNVTIVASHGWETGALQDMLVRLDSGCRIEVASQGPERFSLPLPDGTSLPDLVLLDVDSAAADVSAIIGECIQRYPRARVIAFGSRVDDAHVEKIFEAGALGYLPKSYSEMIVLGVLRLALGDGSHRPSLSSDAKQTGNESAKGTAGATQGQAEIFSEFRLTGRQVEVLSLAAQGKSNQAIAKHLGITEGTTKVHMSSIFKALNVQNRSEAILLASRMQSVGFMQVKGVESGALDLDWLLPHMSHRRVPRDTILFKKGDPCAELWYLQRGTIHLDEIATDVTSGAVFGEIGIFSPSHERTCTAVCTSDVDLFTLTSDHVKRLYLLNPQFALFLVHLISKRLMADRSRMI